MNAISSTYSSRQTIKEALTIFFEKYQLGPDGGMSDRWVKLRFGKFYIPFPNTDSRRKALMFHDIHHIATGYQSNWKGEAEIGAWEVSTGCGSYTAAWVLDLGVLALGLLVFPKATYKAFVKGQRTRSFYKNSYTREQLLSQVWGYDFAGFEHTVNSHINRLRAKIEDYMSKPKYILTSWGVGYCFSDEI